MTLVPVLMYHAVGRPRDESFRRWVISPSLLAEHLAALREAGYDLAGLTEWANKSDSRGCVVLTFDDGYADFMEHALPALAATNARATVYAVTGHVGGRAAWLPFANERNRPMMTWDDLRAVTDYGIEVGSHGHKHIELDAVRPSAAQADVIRSRDALREQGLSPRSFCYPFGYANRCVRNIVADAGFATACVVGRGLADSAKDPLRLRRLAVDNHLPPELLLRRIRGPETTIASRLRQSAQPPWRLVRRVRSIAQGAAIAGVAE